MKRFYIFNLSRILKNLKNTTKLAMRKFVLLLGLFFCFHFFINAQNEVSKEELKRPTVGLVMSGGGAKGFAYIGLLKVLEEVNMPVDYIGGSSMGAITAALYSVGYSAETIEQIIREQDWNTFISDEQERMYISYEEKLFGDKYIYSMPIENKIFSLSKSLNSSFNIDLILNELFAPAAHITDFNDLPVPFLCIGTNLLTGEAVILDKGNLARAVRASMAIPGYFSPTKYDGKYLVDGGVVNNYPVEQVKEMGADIIIGADVQTGLKSNIEEIETMTAVLDQVISFNRVEANLKGYELTDYLVKIEMPFGMLDFDQYDSIIAIGERVAREYYPQLKALADSLNNLENRIQKRENVQPLDSFQINNVVWSEMSLKQGEKYHLDFNELDNKKIAFSELEKKMLLLNGTRNFNELRYEFVHRENDKLDIEIEAGYANKGSIAAGIHYDNTYGGSILLNLSLRNIKGGRSKLFTDLILGQNPRLKSMFIINNGLKPGFGMEVDFYSFNFPQYKNGERINKWDFDNYSFSAFMPITVKNDFLFKAGMEFELFRFKQEVVVDPEYEAYNKFANYGNLFASFNHDTRDKAHYATDGQLMELKIEHVFPFSDQWNDILSNGTILSFRYNSFIRISDKLVYKPELFLGYTITDIKPVPYTETSSAEGKTIVPTVQHLFGFGGTKPNNYVPSHLSFTGFKYLERLGMYAGKFSTNFEYNLYPKFYASVLADVGILENDISSFDEIQILFGYGGKLSYDSFIGPIELTLASSNMDTSLSAFFSIGFWF